MPKDKTKKVETEVSEEKEEKVETPKDPTEELKEELTKAQEEIAKWKNAYYLAYADMKNLRNSLEQEQAEVRKYRGIGFVEELLPTSSKKPQFHQKDLLKNCFQF